MISSIKVRMYRHGFGDCFLLRFMEGNRTKCKMLIDCGLKLNDKGTDVSLADVVKDIKKVVAEKKGGKTIYRLDMLVVTHEHYDHVSAFHPSLKFFDQFQFDKIWMAWTENPEDKEARKINIYLRKSMAAITAAVKKMKANAKKKKEAGFYARMYKGDRQLQLREGYEASLESLSGFWGNFNVTAKTKNGISYKDIYDISIDTMQAFDHIKTKLSKGKSGIEYFEPGHLMDKLSMLPGIRVYVLGPPRNERLNKENASAGAKKETYFGLSDQSMAGFVQGILSSEKYNMEEDDGKPFVESDGLTPEQAKAEPWFKKTYFDEQEEYRQVDDDWLDGSALLALQMDNDTNNTSLVLAFEFIDSKKVLLFPGDAQVGNWLSWHDHEWEITRDGTAETVNAASLLNNTVLYKVSHHCSHNATLKKQGLELMQHEDLVALIPEKQKQYNGIPHPPLRKKLLEKTRGRTIFSADINFPPEGILKKKPDGLSVSEWKEFKENLSVTTTYVEYTVKS